MTRIFKIVTKVGITRTDMKKTSSRNLQSKQNQQRNYETLCQVLSLRFLYKVVSIGQTRVDVDYEYSNKLNITSATKLWVLSVEIQSNDVNTSNTDIISMITNDLHLIPVIPDVITEDPNALNCFITKGSSLNTLIV